MIRSALKTLLLISLITINFSCDEKEDPIRIVLLDPNSYIFIDSVDFPEDFTVQLYQEIETKSATSVGYNRLLFAVYDYDKGDYIKDLKAFSSLSYADDPLVYPSNVTGFKELEYLQQVDTYFAYPTLNGLTWTLNLDLDFNGKKRNIDLDIPNVEESLEEVQLFDYNNDRYQVTLIRPTEPDTGVNQLEFMIDKLNQNGFEKASQFAPGLEVRISDSLLVDFMTTPVQVAERPGFYRGAMLFINPGNYDVKVPLIENKDTVFVLEYLFSAKF